MTETPSRGRGEGANQGTLARLEAGRASEQTLPGVSGKADPAGSFTAPARRGWLADRAGLSWS